MPDPGTGASNAIDLASQLGEIGFAEFTSDLVTNVFNALVDANQQQTGQYIELIRAVSGSLADYVNRTHELVTAEDIDAFLAGLGLKLDHALTAGERESLNDAVEVPSPAGVGAGRDNRFPDPASGDTGPDASDAAVRKTIREAIARRIANNRYDFLKAMVKLGVLRVVVEHGSVETRLIFRTTGLTTRGQSEYERVRNASNAGYAGVGVGLTLAGASVPGSMSFADTIGLVAGYGASNNVSVSTTSSYDRDVTGSEVQIYGRVRLHFKTDYKPLNPG